MWCWTSSGVHGILVLLKDESISPEKQPVSVGLDKHYCYLCVHSIRSSVRVHLKFWIWLFQKFHKRRSASTCGLCRNSTIFKRFYDRLNQISRRCEQGACNFNDDNAQPRSTQHAGNFSCAADKILKYKRLFNLNLATLFNLSWQCCLALSNWHFLSMINQFILDCDYTGRELRARVLANRTVWLPQYCGRPQVFLKVAMQSFCNIMVMKLKYTIFASHICTRIYIVPPINTNTHTHSLTLSLIPTPTRTKRIVKNIRMEASLPLMHFILTTFSATWPTFSSLDHNEYCGMISSATGLYWIRGSEENHTCISSCASYAFTATSESDRVATCINGHQSTLISTSKGNIFNRAWRLQRHFIITAFIELNSWRGQFVYYIGPRYCNYINVIRAVRSEHRAEDLSCVIESRLCSNNTYRNVEDNSNLYVNWEFQQ